MTSAEILERLVAFSTVSHRSNRDVVDYLKAFLGARGIAPELFWSEDGEKASLFATLGPSGRPGIVLSGHTDVVATEGQAWSTDPFAAPLHLCFSQGQ